MIGKYLSEAKIRDQPRPSSSFSLEDITYIGRKVQNAELTLISLLMVTYTRPYLLNQMS